MAHSEATSVLKNTVSEQTSKSQVQVDVYRAISFLFAFMFLVQCLSGNLMVMIFAGLPGVALLFYSIWGR